MSSFDKKKSLILAAMAMASMVAFGCGSDDSDDGADCYGAVCGSNQKCDDVAKKCVDNPGDCSALGQKMCSAVCTNVFTDTQNCGDCGIVCNPGEICDGGSCKAPGACNADQRECNGACKDVKTDPQNCGNCGITCGDTQICQNGSCTDKVTCDLNKTQCGDQCYDLKTDDNNCGECGNACKTGQKCTNNKCVDACDEADKCNGVCVNKMVDDNNCGTCGNVCKNGQECKEGGCIDKVICTGEEVVCGTTCADLTKDSKNCGSCGNVCPTGQNCVNSDCSDGEITEKCDTSEKPVCVGNSIKTCQEDGEYSYEDCGEEVCTDGICQPVSEDDCESEGFIAFCEGNSIKSCVNNKYVLTECTDQVCEAGTCIDSGDLVKCEDSFVPRCEGNNAISCTNGYEKSTSCGSLVCVNGECLDIECDSEHFDAQCDGDDAVLTCVENQKVSTKCGENQLCINAECKDLPSDLCPFDPDKKAPGVCGCGIPDLDLDNNGIVDCVESGVDLCPDDADKTTPGICGCNIPDTLEKGIPKCLSGAENFEDVDLCPDDPNKNLPGVCGCGFADTIDELTHMPICIVDENIFHEKIGYCQDSKVGKVLPGVCGCEVKDEIDSNTGVPKCLADDIDLCPDDPDKTAPGICGCGKKDDSTDTDKDGVPDCMDQCPNNKYKTIEDSCLCDRLSYNLDGNTICAFPIASAEDFVTFRDNINNNKNIPNNASTAAVLLNDININDAVTGTWVGIGTQSRNYLGKFVSTGKTISGTLNCTSANCALFSYVNGSRIHNVNANLNVTAANNAAMFVANASGATFTKIKAKGSVSGSSNVGGVVAIANGGSLNDVEAETTITGTSNTIGGVIGNATSATLTNIKHTGKITSAGSYSGGIVGYAKETKLSNATNTGDIESQGEQTGGIVGRMTGGSTGSQLIATGNISITASKNYTGGVVGLLDGESSISDAQSQGTVSSLNQRVGGIAGQVNGKSKLTNVSSTVEITNTASYTGGIVGLLYDSSSIDKAEFTGKVTAKDHTGGIVGRMESKSTISNADVEAPIVGVNYTGGVLGSTHPTIDDMAVSDVTMKGTVSGNSYVGGIAGYARADLSNATNDAPVTGSRVMGGIVGEFGSGSMTNLTNNGTVTATNDVSGTAYVGGITGYLVGGSSHSKLTNTAAINVTTTQTSGYCNSTGGIIGFVSDTTNGTMLTEVKNSGDVSSIGTYVGGIIGNANTTSFKDVENTGNVTAGTDNNTGGIIGELYFRGLPSEKGIDFVFDNVKNSGDVSGGYRVAGIVGHLWANGIGANVALKDVQSSGAITGTKDNVGGIIGRLIHNGNVTITNAKNTGDITGSANYVGGLIGTLSESNESGFSSTGARTVTTTIDHSSSEATVKGNLNVGGFAGYISTNFVNHNVESDILVTCYNDSSVTKTYNRTHYFDATNNIVIRNSYSAGIIDANNVAGGFVGLVEGTSDEKSYTSAIWKFVYDPVTKDPCKWTSFTTEADGAIEKINGIGKLSIVNSYTSNKVKGQSKDIGGLFGKINYTNKLTATNNYKFLNAYSAGFVDNIGGSVVSAKPSAADFSKVYVWKSAGPAYHTVTADIEGVTAFDYTSAKIAKIDTKTLVEVLNDNVKDSDDDDLKSANSDTWIEKEASIDTGMKVKLAGFDF
ncbi:MAG: hypothetical protein IJU23_11150 [Proteobacteria bacterium]|nr:hypothetical protein [Pseudomonadota bacterium]